MPALSPRLGIWIVVALATTVGIYVESQGGASFVRLLAVVTVAALTLIVVERRRWQQLEATDAAEREAMTASLATERERAQELERLLQFAEQVGNATEIGHLQRSVQESLGPLVQTRDIWLTARVGGWQDAFRDNVIQSPTGGKGRRGWETFPLRVAGKAIGVLGVAQEDGPFEPRQRRFATYAASIIAIALKNVQLFQAIKEQNITDPLTGCATRTHGLELLARELRRAARSGSTASLLMIDADHFKGINDRYGHACGDTVLRHIGRVLRTSVRATDLPFRYGGEEFVIVLPETSSTGAAKLAESIRQTINREPVSCGSFAIPATVSCGIATTRAGEIDPTDLIARADEALYEAKSAGRNGVQVFGEARTEGRSSAEWGSRERRDPARPDRRQRPGGRRNTDASQVH